MAYGDMGLENAQTFDLVKEAVGLLDVDVLLHIGIGSKVESRPKACLVQNLARCSLIFENFEPSKATFAMICMKKMVTKVINGWTLSCQSLLIFLSRIEI